jgi:hypothetical protein
MHTDYTDLNSFEKKPKPRNGFEEAATAIC